MTTTLKEVNVLISNADMDRMRVVAPLMWYWHMARRQSLGLPSRNQKCEVSYCAEEGTHNHLCQRHYHLKQMSGDPTKARRKPTACTIDGCTGKYLGNGLCAKHYMRQRRKEGKP